jgi:hypothetical protein
MKTLQKSLTDKLPKTVFVKSDLSLLFPEGYEPFAEKNARAKERLSKAKFPEGFGLK